MTNGDDAPIFFVHVMKTGGVTLFENVRAQYEPDEVYPDDRLDLRRVEADRLAFRHMTIRYLQRLGPERRARIRLYAGHFPFVTCELLGGDFRTVTILRDPVERTISLLRQFQRAVEWLPGGPDAVPYPLPLEEVYEQTHVFEPLVHDHQTKIFSMTAADEPTGFMQVIHVDESRLALAKANLETVDVIGLMEDYPAFLDEVERAFGWRVDRSSRKNVAPPAEVAEDDAALRARIAEDNAIDVELYAFARELVARRRRTATQP